MSSRLTLAQHDVVIALTLPSPIRQSIATGIVGARRALRTHGGEAVESAGGNWPVELDPAHKLAVAGHRTPGLRPR